MEKYQAIIKSFADGQHTLAIEQIKAFGLIKLTNYMENDETCTLDQQLYILKTFIRRT